jgi:hypothetical protein
MTFTIDSSALKEGIETVLLSGKYGEKNSSLNDEIVLYGTDTHLQLWNGDASLICSIDIPYVVEIAPKNCIISSNDILPFLKKMKGELIINIEDNLSITQDNTQITVPLLVAHPNRNAIEKIMSSCILSYSFEEEIPLFLNTSFESALELTSDSLIEALTLSEVVGTGIFNFNINEENNLIISSRTNTKTYSKELIPLNFKGERATVDFTSPIHKFFKNTETITVFLKDDFPLYFISDDRRILRAPRLE